MEIVLAPCHMNNYSQNAPRYERDDSKEAIFGNFKTSLVVELSMVGGARSSIQRNRDKMVVFSPIEQDTQRRIPCFGS